MSTLIYQVVFVLFMTALFTSCIVSIASGEWPERVGCLLIFLATFATPLIESSQRLDFGVVELRQLIVDGTLMIGMLAVALKADRWWPMLLWPMVLFQFLGHVIRLSAVDFDRWLYWFTDDFWSLPTVAILTVGVFKHRRRRAISSRRRSRRSA